MNFCLNCRVFGDPLVVHRDSCPHPIVVTLKAEQIGFACHVCGDVHLDKAGQLPHRCCTMDCTGDYLIPVYEYPKELRRS